MQRSSAELNRVAEVLLLSSSLLTDRVLAHTGLVPSLRPHCTIRIRATSCANSRFAQMWNSVNARVEPFPATRPFREFPHNYLRRLNEFAWDYYLPNPSRLSKMRHLRDRQQWPIRVLKYPARAIAALGLPPHLENVLEKLLVDYDRSPEARARFETERPALVVSTGTFRYEEPAIVGAARRLGIPTLAFVTSWDNISIKGRMVLRYDGYLVWSERMKQELLQFYPCSRQVPIYIVGAPQFDVFFQTGRYVSRTEFCRRLGLCPDRPILVYALGVAHGVAEHHGALELARRIARGELGQAQLIVRLHPFHDHSEMYGLFREFAPRVALQRSADSAEARNQRSQTAQEIDEWVNTFRHADVVIHRASTAGIDAAIFDRPSVCLDYDPEPGQPHQAIVKDVNHLWTHYQPVAESGGMWLVNNPDELAHAIRTYLRHPELHRERRRWMAEYVCGYLDGRCGERMAAAVLDFMQRPGAAGAKR